MLKVMWNGRGYGLIDQVTFDQEFAKNIRRRRKELALTQAQLGNKLFSNCYKVIRIEKGASLTTWELYLICNALDCSVNDLWPVASDQQE